LDDAEIAIAKRAKRRSVDGAPPKLRSKDAKEEKEKKKEKENAKLKAKMKEKKDTKRASTSAQVGGAADDAINSVRPFMVRAWLGSEFDAS
jgi:hypothetical protein